MDKKVRTIDIEKIEKRAKYLCAKREKCSSDMRLKLIQWGITRPDAEIIINKLVKEGFINDNRYAAIFVREKIHFNKWGTIKIAQALRIKGITDKIINDALNQIEEKTEEESLVVLLNKKISSIKSKTKYELKAKLIRFGLSRGYKYDDVLKIASKIVKDQD
jgi:regulatory protein